MNFLYRIKKRFFRISSDEYIAELRKEGAQIGKKVKFFNPSKTLVDRTRPWLISIGNYTKITGGAVILSHDYSLSVMRRVYGEWIGEGQETVIGENCFIGMNVIILMGTRIGNNTIVGAGSVVHGKFPDNVVLAGNPAKIICSLEEHYKKRQSRTREEALSCARRYYDVFRRKPTPKDMQHFKFLFAPRKKEVVEQYGLNFLCSGDEPSEVEEAFYRSDPIWKDFDDFLREAYSEKNC